MKRHLMVASLLSAALGFGTAGVVLADEAQHSPETKKDKGAPGFDVDVKDGQNIDDVDDPGAPGVDVDVNTGKKKDPRSQDADKGVPGVDMDKDGSLEKE